MGNQSKWPIIKTTNNQYPSENNGIIRLNPLLYITNIESGIDISGNNNNLLASTIFDANDSFTFPNTTAVKNAFIKTGAYDVFFDWADNPRKIKLSQLEYQYGSNFFHNGEILLLFSDSLTTQLPTILNILWSNSPSKVFGMKSDGFMKDNLSNGVSLKTCPYFKNGEYSTFPASASYNLSVFTAAITFQVSKIPTGDYAMLFTNSKGGHGWEIRLRSNGEINCIATYTSGSPVYTNCVTHIPYLDGDEHTVMLVQNGNKLILETEFERIETTNIVTNPTLLYDSGSQVTINNRNGGIFSLNNIFLSYARIYNIEKTYKEVSTLDTTGLVFRSDDCYHESIQNVNSTLTSGGKTIAQMTYEINADPYYAGFYYTPHYNFNPNNNIDALSLLLDKGSYVGNSSGKPEIWNKTYRTGIDPNYWRSTYLCQEAVLSDVESGYLDKIWIKQIKYAKDNKSQRFFHEIFIQLFSSALINDDKLYDFVGFKKNSYIIKNIHSLTDYSSILNTALSSYSNVVIHNCKFIVNDSVLVNSNQNLTWSNSCLKLGPNINKNLFRNSDFDNGNSDITIKGVGRSLFYGNSQAQNRSIYPATGRSLGFWNYYMSFFVKVTDLIYKNMELSESAGWSCAFQRCTNADISNIEIYGMGKYVENQDGIGIHFGSYKCFVRFINCLVRDDILPLLNYNLSNDTGYGWGYPDDDMTRVTQYIHAYSMVGKQGEPLIRTGNLIRIYSNYSTDSYGTNHFVINHIKAYDMLIKCTKIVGTYWNTISFGGGTHGMGDDFEFWNIYGGAYGGDGYNFQNYWENGNWSNITINQTVDDPDTNYPYLLKINSGVTVTNVTVTSKLLIQPSSGIISSSGTLINFVHTEN